MDTPTNGHEALATIDARNLAYMLRCHVAHVGGKWWVKGPYECKQFETINELRDYLRAKADRQRDRMEDPCHLIQ